MKKKYMKLKEYGHFRSVNAIPFQNGLYQHFYFHISGVISIGYGDKFHHDNKQPCITISRQEIRNLLTWTEFDKKRYTK